MFKRVRSFDAGLYVLPVALWLIGCSVLWSLTYANPDQSIATLAIKQLIFGILGLAASFGISLIDYRALRQSAWIIGVVTILLLLAVELFGTTSLGATRWLDFRVFQLQPSEIAKISLVVVLATYLVHYIERVSVRMFLCVIAILAVPLALVLKQPDLGTAILLVITAIGMILSLHLKRKHYIAMALGLMVFVSAGSLAYANVPPAGRLLHSYQRDRIRVFLNPESDPLGKGYNVRQAIIAVGNGGLLGRGLGKEVGQLSQLNFLPKAYTDFIFAALAEALGFVGAAVVLGLFTLLLWRILSIAAKARDGFGSLLCYGFLVNITFSILINVGMNLGIMPVTGIPLPFVSAGGTALIMNFVGIGLVQSVVSRRQKIQFD